MAWIYPLSSCLILDHISSSHLNIHQYSHQPRTLQPARWWRPFASLRPEFCARETEWPNGCFDLQRGKNQKFIRICSHYGFGRRRMKKLSDTRRGHHQSGARIRRCRRECGSPAGVQTQGLEVHIPTSLSSLFTWDVNSTTWFSSTALGCGVILCMPWEPSGCNKCF